MAVNRQNIQMLQIDNDSDIGVCRRKAVTLANQLDFNEVQKGEIAILVTELVTNVLKHGGGKGKVVFSKYTDENDNNAIEIWCCDIGDGIVNPNLAMQDGYTGKSSLGLGLGSIRRLSDNFEINPANYDDVKSQYFAGLPIYKNCIRALKYIPQKQWLGTNHKIIIGAASREKPGEKVNGDCYVVSHINAHTTIVAVIDGLGHGSEANMASQLAKEQIILKSDLPVDSIMLHTHQMLRSTRGCVLAIAKINTDKKTISFSGIGNIESYLLTSNAKKSLLSFGGIIGHNMRTPRVYENTFEPGDSLVMYSDGILSRWNFKDFDWDNHPQQLAELLLTNHSRINDDATVLIIRHAD